MAPPTSRRRLLRLAGTAVAAGLAGCSRAAESAGPVDVTPAPVPSDGPAASASPAPDGTTPTAADLGFDVAVRSGFDEASPARLAIAFWNAGDRRLTAMDGPRYFLPFVDDDFAAQDDTGEPSLMLVPDDSTLAVDPEGSSPGRVGEFLPEAPVDGCWSLPFDWPAARGPSTLTLLATTLAPGDRREHTYGLYFVDDCAPGSYRFVNTFDLVAGDPPREDELVRAWLGFDVWVDESLAVRVAVLEPTVGRRGGEP